MQFNSIELQRTAVRKTKRATAASPWCDSVLGIFLQPNAPGESRVSLRRTWPRRRKAPVLFFTPRVASKTTVHRRLERNQPICSFAGMGAGPR